MISIFGFHALKPQEMIEQIAFHAGFALHFQAEIQKERDCASQIVDHQTDVIDSA